MMKFKERKQMQGMARDQLHGEDQEGVMEAGLVEDLVAAFLEDMEEDPV